MQNQKIKSAKTNNLPEQTIVRAPAAVKPSAVRGPGNQAHSHKTFTIVARVPCEHGVRRHQDGIC